MTLKKTLLAATMLALPLAAQAQTVNGLYIAAGAGLNWHNRVSGDLSFSDPQNIRDSGTTPHSISTGTGFVALASIGWGFGNGLRAEIEGSYRQNGVRDVVYGGTSPRGLPGYDVTGQISTAAVMANLFYDFRIGPVMPYVGAGIGYAWQRYQTVGFTSPGEFAYLSGQRGSFAYQGIAGLALPIAAVPGLALTAEYRYFATAAVTMRGSVTASEGLGNLAMRVRNQNHSVLLGVRYNFGRPAPMPVVAAQPAPARSFIVFFDFDRSDLTARAREIIAQAANAARSQQVTRIELAGHADRSGSDQYNIGLSQRRANSVAGELVRLGVPRGAITTAAFGESRPLVPTADGVREPQNRRVEIVLR